MSAGGSREHEGPIRIDPQRRACRAEILRPARHDGPCPRKDFQWRPDGAGPRDGRHRAGLPREQRGERSSDKLHLQLSPSRHSRNAEEAGRALREGPQRLQGCRMTGVPLVFIASIQTPEGRKEITWHPEAIPYRRQGTSPERRTSICGSAPMISVSSWLAGLFTTLFRNWRGSSMRDTRPAPRRFVYRTISSWRSTTTRRPSGARLRLSIT